MAKEFHVVLLPWSAFGHMIPFFQLSIALAKFGVQVSFVSTPKNIERLPKVPSNLAYLINLVKLPLPKPPNGGDLPDGAEATMDIPFEKIPQLKMAYDLLQYPFQKFVENQSPNWIITDFMAHWVFDFAQESQIPVMYFSVFSSAVNVFMGPPEYATGEGEINVRSKMESLMSPPPWVSFTSLVALKKHEAITLFDNSFISNVTQVSDVERYAKVLHKCQAMCARACSELEGDPYLDLLKELLTGKPVMPTGFLPSEKHEGSRHPKSQSEKVEEESWNHVFEWLDEQKPKSVVFVGFGSECKLSKEEIHEIAYGLELSDVPFMWALRRPEWAHEDDDETQVLPLGFGSRTRGRGLVNMGWAPQVEILSHKSIGGSLFHAGFGSIIEILAFGHSLVLLPMIVDQGLNARLVVEKGLGVEIEREEDGSFSGQDIAKALKMAMVLEEGEPLRVRARKAATIIGDLELQHQHYIGQLVHFLKSYNTNN